MGIAIASIRLQELTMEQIDLQYKISLISTAIGDLSNTINDILTVGTDLDPNSPEMKAIQNRKERLYVIEKKLNEQMTRMQTRLKLVEAQIGQARQNIDRSIQHTFGGR